MKREYVWTCEMFNGTKRRFKDEMKFKKFEHDNMMKIKGISVEG